MASKPVVIGIIVQALWLLGRKAVKNIWTNLIAGSHYVFTSSGSATLLLAAGGPVIMAGRTLHACNVGERLRSARCVMVDSGLVCYWRCAIQPADLHLLPQDAVPTAAATC